MVNDFEDYAFVLLVLMLYFGSVMIIHERAWSKDMLEYLKLKLFRVYLALITNYLGEKCLWLVWLNTSDEFDSVNQNELFVGAFC